MAESACAAESKETASVVPEGAAVSVMFAIAVESVEVRRVREVPRRTRKSCGRTPSVALRGPVVVVTVPEDAFWRVTTCLRGRDSAMRQWGGGGEEADGALTRSQSKARLGMHRRRLARISSGGLCSRK
jgi:hypothetical protein